jgi:hypothetical protein
VFALGSPWIADYRGAAPIHGDPRQRVDPAPPLIVIDERAPVVRHAGIGVGVGDGDQIGSVRKRQRAQQHAVHHGEDRQRGPHAQRERGNGAAGEARRLSQRTPGVPDGSSKLFQRLLELSDHSFSPPGLGS